MEEIINNCIKTRKDALLNTYQLTDEGALKRIDDYFVKLEEFAKTCKDCADFEAKFASSEYAKEYTDLFVMASEIVDPTVVEPDPTFADEVKKDAEMYARRKVHQKAYDEARSLPIIGEAMTAKQHFDFFSRFRKKKDD